MKKTVLFSLVLLIATISTQVEGKKRKPHGRPTSPLKMGWRFGNGRCVCKGLSTPSTFTGWHRTHYPTARHHGPPRHHPSQHHGHYPSPAPHGPPRHHPSQQHGHYPSPAPHGPPMRHRSGPHSPPRRRYPTRRPIGNNHKARGPRTRQRGPHHHGPTRKHGMKVWKPCVCRKPADKSFKIKFRMMKNWRSEMANPKSEVYRRLTYKLFPKLAKVLKTKSIYNMRYTKGSIVAEFEVKKTEITKDPEKALRHAINKGELSDLEIQPESLAVHQSYSGVKLSEWKTDEAECHRCGTVKQTRECTEVTASCDGIPLTRNASCYEVCPRSRIISCGRGGRRMVKVMIIACFIIIGAIVLVAVLVITKVKRARRKHLSTSPSTSSIKKLADDDKLQSKC